MNYLKRKISGLKKRLKSAKYGIFYFRDKELFVPECLRINGKSKRFKFMDFSSAEMAFEFNEICINDCYHLTDLKKLLSEVRVIVDIGANQGLFAIAARQHFAHASITCYEPNKILESVLSHNAHLLNAKVYYEAVSLTDCKLRLNFGKSELHTQTEYSEKGNITGTAFSKLVQRAGGNIDIVKIDCEGAEWELLEDTSLWRGVKSVTMEYHLWANKSKTPEDVMNRLNEFGMKIISDERISGGYGLITAARLN